jgi:hypothetical protein
MTITKGMLIKALLVSSVVLTLFGCGGGGGGSPTSSQNLGQTSSIQFNGAATKGIIQNGIVTAEELDSTGLAIKTVGSAVTAADGSYQLSLSNDYSGGPIKVTLTKDSSTEMKCDVPAGCGNRTDDITDPNGNTAIDFGEWYKPATLSLTALVPEAADNDTIGVNITPYTHLAAQTVLATPNVTATTVADTNSEISNLLGGVDILNTRPLDITDATAVHNGTATEMAYAALASSISSLADVDSNGQPDIGASLSRLVNSFSSGRFAADDSGASNDNAIYSMKEIIQTAGNTFSKIGLSDTSGVFANIEDEIKNAVDTDGDGIPDISPKPSGTAGDTRLAKVKAMVSDVRTWGTVIHDQLDAPGKAFGNQIELASQSVSLMHDYGFTDSLWNSLGNALRVYLLEGGGSDLSQYPINPDPLNLNHFDSGTITEPTPGTIVIAGSMVGTDTFKVNIQLPADGSTASSIVLGITSATTSSQYLDASIDAGTITLNLPQPYTINWNEIQAQTAQVPDINSVEINLKTSVTQKYDLQANQPFADPITFDGEFKTLVYLDTAINSQTGKREVTWATPSTVNIGGVIQNTTGDNIDANITLNIANAETFSPVSDNVVEDQSNWLDADMGVTFSAQLDGLPKAMVTITGNRTSFDTGDADLSMTFGNRSIKFSGTANTTAETFDSEITITNQDGVQLIIKPDPELKTGTIRYNGKVYGTILETQSGLIKINYIDGSFEVF